MAVLTAAAVLALASQYGDWDANVVVWLTIDAGTGHGESSGRTDAFNPAGPYRGLLQIADFNAVRFGFDPLEMYEPAKNIEVAHRLWLERGFAPWPSSVKYKGAGAMSVTPDGWLTWAERMPGRPATGPGFNAGVNDVRGLVFHSAEGWAETMLSKTSQWGYYSAEYPWHLSNLLDGRLIQHQPFHVRCWHGSAFNDSYVGMEHEGVTPKDATVGPVLNDLQVANARRVIASLSEWKGWTPKRPTSASDKTATLYQHGEVVRFGGSSTQCPSHRIPWAAILTPTGEEIMLRHNTVATRLQGATGGVTVTPDLFDVPPPPSKLLRIEVYLTKDAGGTLQAFDADGKYAGQVGWDGARYGCIDVTLPFTLQGSGIVAQLGVVGYWT